MEEKKGKPSERCVYPRLWDDLTREILLSPSLNDSVWSWRVNTESRRALKTC